MQTEIAAHAQRGCCAVDVTGGEPLRYPEILALVEECKKRGMSVRIISSLVVSASSVDAAILAGTDGFLVSMHGAKAETHDAITGIPKSREIQLKRLEQIGNRASVDVNYVMIRDNQSEIIEFVDVCPKSARVVNFINFNPHYEWRLRPETADLVADLRVLGTQLDEAIDVLESRGIGVNVRYLPMCALRACHRRCVCNDLHVAFDPGEWNNAIPGSEFEQGRKYGLDLSNANEKKGPPCCECDLQWICGGANRVWHAASHETFGEQLSPVTGTRLQGSMDFWHYRQRNQMGFIPLGKQSEGTSKSRNSRIRVI